MRKRTMPMLVGLAALLFASSPIHPQRLYRDQVAVLLYHHVHDSDLSGGTITAKQFRGQLAFLKSNHYRFIRLDELRAFLNGAAVPDNAVLVTFDDGYESFYQNAYPILKEFGIPAVVFLITGNLDEQTRVPSLSRSQIRTMQRDTSLIDFGCHTSRLHTKTAGGAALLTGKLVMSETEEDYRARVESDIADCIRQLEQLSPGSSDTLAYPFGAYDQTAAALAHRRGVRYAFTVLPRMTTRSSDPMRIPRIHAGSPSLKPADLHNSIMRRVAPAPHPAGVVDLRDTLEQLGAELAVDRDGGLLISYNGDRWKVQPGSSNVEHLRGAGERFRLSAPIRSASNRTYIRPSDIQNIIGVPVTYDPDTRSYTGAAPSRSGFEDDGGGASDPAP